MHAPRFADLFEVCLLLPRDRPAQCIAPRLTRATLKEFTSSQPQSSSSSSTSQLGGGGSSTSATAASATHIPYEDIAVAPQHEPLNPEDEDDVVPDQHAAFGITRAMAAREARERAWRDFGGLRDLVRGTEVGMGTGSQAAAGARGGKGGGSGAVVGTNGTAAR